jgi:hypothetical protein
MIELKNDKLQFSFPKVSEDLRKLAKEYALETLPRVLEEDRDAALNEFLSCNYRFRRASEKEREGMRRFVQELSRDKIADAFQKKVHAEARFDSEWRQPGHMTVEFQRTLRIPDDGKDYYLPPGLGKFPLRHLDDYADRAPASWLERGGVLMPMYQAEALWIKLDGGYPFAVKIASGKINAITGEDWRSGLNRQPQDYLVLPEQPWLDGIAVEKGIIRQFVAMPLGAGYSVEEQITGKADFGGIQIQVHPMKAEIYFRDEVLPKLPKTLADILPDLLPKPKFEFPTVYCCPAPGICAESGMGLGAGGRMKQEIYQDERDSEVWDTEQTSRCFVHLCNSLVWREITGTNPPQPPVTAKEYERCGLPWFDFYRDDVPALNGSDILAKVKTVVTVSQSKGDGTVLGNDSVETPSLVHCGPKKRPDEVREWSGV